MESSVSYPKRQTMPIYAILRCRDAFRVMGMTMPLHGQYFQDKEPTYDIIYELDSILYIIIYADNMIIHNDIY